MGKENHKAKVNELRKYHEPVFIALGVPSAYFAAKYPHTPKGASDKALGFFDSELAVGDDIYVECVTMDYAPLDQNNRMLYKLAANPQYKTTYPYNGVTHQYMVPVLDLKVVRVEGLTKIESPKTGVEAFSLIRRIKDHYETFEFEGKDPGTRHSVTFKNGSATNYKFISKDNQVLWAIDGGMVEEMIKFFKQLKTTTI